MRSFSSPSGRRPLRRSVFHGFWVIAAIGCGGNASSTADAATDSSHGHDAQHGKDGTGAPPSDSGAEASREGGHHDATTDVGTETGSDAGSMDAGKDTGTLSSTCAAAVAAIDWAPGALDCTTAAPTGWAMGLAPTYEALFESQCEGAMADKACANEAKTYFDCLAKNGGSCGPCVDPNSGECKGSAGVVFSTACGTDETSLAVCACKPSGSSCKKDTDCCAPLTLGVTCLSSSCTY